jgi:hypothetical protein
VLIAARTRRSFVFGVVGVELSANAASSGGAGHPVRT